MQSSTLEGNAAFYQALNIAYVGAGVGLGRGYLCHIDPVWSAPSCWCMGWCAGWVRPCPHAIILEVAGAFLGRFFFLKRYGAMWRQYAPVLLAGFSCGMGLTGMFAMGVTLILNPWVDSPINP